jgi:hypothetical protein
MPQRAVAPPIGARSVDLLYVSNGSGDVTVYRYWGREPHQVLTGFKAPKGECVDAVNDVFITDSKLSEIFEYQHGAKKPVQILKDRGYRPYGCSIDFTTGNLAVANNRTRAGGPGGIALYKGAVGEPKFYGIKYLPNPIACAYDNNGNLFVASLLNYSGYLYASFAYLPHGTTSFINVTIPYLGSGPFDLVSDVQWDGTYWAIEDEGSILRYSIDQNGNPTYEGLVDLNGHPYTAGQFWVNNFKNRSLIVTVESVYYSEFENIVQYWDYPAGGSSVGSITKYLNEPFGVTLSRGVK